MSLARTAVNRDTPRRECGGQTTKVQDVVVPHRVRDMPWTSGLKSALGWWQTPFDFSDANKAAEMHSTDG